MILGYQFIADLNKTLVSYKLSDQVVHKTLLVKCRIDTTSDKIVSWTRPIRSLKDRKELERIIDDLEKRGIIEPSVSMWCHPIVLTSKKSGETRFCVDFRRLNDLVELDGFPIPKINEMISQLHEYEYFTTLDLKDGFFQVDIEKNDREKTAFLAGERLMQFIKMPQGFKNSPGIFQRAMTQVLKDFIGKKCLVYIDDVLIFGRTEREHDDNFNDVIKRLNEYNLKENIEKRRYKKQIITFLGYEIGKGKIRPTIQRSQGIAQYKTLQNKKEVQRFLGLINYDRNVVKNLSSKSLLLYKLIKKDNKFDWCVECNDAFLEIKKNWEKELELRIPDMSKEFELETDASDTGLGAVLKQEGEPIAYISRLLKSAETNYTITEKEVLASLWAMEKFRFLLSGKHFKLITDHKAMEALKKKVEFGSRRVIRWFERFEGFNFDVIYRSGAKMVAADALSRAAEKEDDIEKKSIEAVLKLHVEKDHRKNLVSELKQNNIELSSEKIKKILRTCKVCKMTDRKYCKPQNFIRTKFPGELVGVDLMEINKTKRIIVLIDYFTRKIFAEPIKRKTGANLLSFLTKIHKEFPFKQFVCDNGKEFVNKAIKEWSENNGVKLVRSVPYYHESNGRVERAIRTIRTALKKQQSCDKDTIRRVICNYNNMIHRGINMTPNEAQKRENWDGIEKFQEKYASEFENRKRRNFERFEKGNRVLIRKEIQHTKMDNEFEDEGVIMEILSENTFKIKLDKGGEAIRHSAQLRRL